MQGFIVVDVNIKNMDGFMEYASRIPELIEKYQGKYIVKRAEPKIIREGPDIPQYLVVIEFPSVELADEFIEARAKTDLIDIFNRSTEGRVIRVEGCL